MAGGGSLTKQENKSDNKLECNLLDAGLFQFIEDYVWNMYYNGGMWFVHTVDSQYYGTDLRKVLLNIKEEII